MGAVRSSRPVTAPVENRMHSTRLKERGRSTFFVSLGWTTPCAQGKTRLSLSSRPVEATAKDLCHTTTGSHVGLPDKHLHSATSQCQPSHCSLRGQNDHTILGIPSHTLCVVELVLFRVIFRSPT